MTSKPWLSLYTGEEFPAEFRPGTLADLLAEAVTRDSQAPAIHYFDATITFGELDDLSGKLARYLTNSGLKPGDRVGLFMQNIPQFVIAVAAIWKLGAIAVTISPMSRALELGKILPDCRPAAMLCQDDILEHALGAVESISAYRPLLLSTSPHAFQTREDARVLPERMPPGDIPEMLDVIAGIDEAGSFRVPPVAPSDTAALIYTSGTTGQPKGAILSHANMSHNAEAVLRWYHLKSGMGPILCMAPMFHVSGLMHVTFSWALGEALVLTYRFQPDVVLAAIDERRPCFTVAAITAYIALLNAPVARADQFDGFHVLLSGGAAIPPAVVAAFEEKTGRYIHNGYGLTETSAGIVAVPFNSRAPVDQASGTMSIGVPKYGVDLWIAGEDGEPLGCGEIGEVVLSGAAVSAGYWNKPAETAESMRADGFRTGDVGFVDEAGWVYLVDRKKDMINASGYKVWPREVEDVLFAHPSVREAGVTGIPDAYRGETVRAIVSLKSGSETTPSDLIAWCRDRMSPYKVPREVVILDELPKTPSGKVLRRALRELDL